MQRYVTTFQITNHDTFCALDCECNKEGSINFLCNDDGICTCKNGIEGDRCSRCKQGYSGFPNCQKAQLGKYILDWAWY